METATFICFTITVIWMLFLTTTIFTAHATIAKIGESVDKLFNRKVETPAIKNTCDHSWHPLINEHQDDQRIIVIECIKCGSISKDIIGRCNHEWEETDNILCASKYEVAVEPIKELMKRMSSGSAKYDKAMKQIMDKWITDDNTEGTNFERKSVRVKTCKRCGDIFVLDCSNSHLSARLMTGEKQPMLEANSTS